MAQTRSHIPDASLGGQLLIAMPGMPDERFAGSLIYVCDHSDEGAMGLMINKPANQLNFGELVAQIDLLADEPTEMTDAAAKRHVYAGGPVDASRGFVLHSADYHFDGSTMELWDGISLTATTEILKDIARGSGPRRLLLVLGYSGWGPGQLETELAANGWLTCPADADLVFADDADTKYGAALSKLGIDPSHLVSEAGHA